MEPLSIKDELKLVLTLIAESNYTNKENKE